MGYDRRNLEKKRHSLSRNLDELYYSLEPLFHLDFEKLKRVKRIIKEMDLLIDDFQPHVPLTIEETKKRTELIGVLPIMLMSKKIFPTHNSLYMFAFSLFGVDLKSRLSRPARTRIVGEILKEAMKVSKNEWGPIADKIKNVANNQANLQTKSFFSDWDSTITG